MRQGTAADFPKDTDNQKENSKDEVPGPIREYVTLQHVCGKCILVAEARILAETVNLRMLDDTFVKSLTISLRSVVSLKVIILRRHPADSQNCLQDYLICPGHLIQGRLSMGVGIAKKSRPMRTIQTVCTFIRNLPHIQRSK